MTERHVDFVNQVIRCLMLERHLEKGSWPSLLQEITFYCNNLDNTSSKILSPHMLAFGRQPRAPIDMRISTGNVPTKVTGSSSQYLETTVEKRQDDRNCTRKPSVHPIGGGAKKYDKARKHPT